MGDTKIDMEILRETGIYQKRTRDSRRDLETLVENWQY